MYYPRTARQEEFIAVAAKLADRTLKRCVVDALDGRRFALERGQRWRVWRRPLAG